MNEEDLVVKDFAEWARTTQAGYGEDEADIWFEDLPAYDALEWKVREIVRSLLTSRDTYWKERVRKEVEKLLVKEYMKGSPAQYQNKILITLLDNLK